VVQSGSDEGDDLLTDEVEAGGKHEDFILWRFGWVLDQETFCLIPAVPRASAAILWSTCGLSCRMSRS
jgi:hypothetical protein